MSVLVAASEFLLAYFLIIWPISAVRQVGMLQSRVADTIDQRLWGGFFFFGSQQQTRHHLGEFEEMDVAEARKEYITGR